MGIEKSLLKVLPLLDYMPKYLGKITDTLNDYVNWDIVEYCLNNPQFYPIEIIKDNRKIPVPKQILPWHNTTPIANKKYIMDSINQGSSFVILNYSYNNIFTLELMNAIANKFNVHPDIHIYGGLTGSTSFPKHTDQPSNIIIQAEGETPWKVWKDPDADPVIDRTLKQGEALYIPAGCYHMAEPVNKRLSISIPCWHRSPEDTANYNHRNFYKINHF